MPKSSHREAILEAGLSAFHKNGYSATSVQDIVVLAGSPKGSFYNHFDSKEMLGNAVLDLYWDQAEDARAILQDSSFSVPERIDGHLEALGCPEDGCLLGNFTAELASEDVFRSHLGEKWSLWITAISSCLNEGQTDGSVRRDMSSQDLAQFVLNQWEGALLQFRIGRDASLLTKTRSLIQQVIKS